MLRRFVRDATARNVDALVVGAIPVTTNRPRPDIMVQRQPRPLPRLPLRVPATRRCSVQLPFGRMVTTLLRRLVRAPLRRLLVHLRLWRAVSIQWRTTILWGMPVC